MTYTDEDKESFYNDFERIISTTPHTDKLIILGDFNARVGDDYHGWRKVIGSNGVGKVNSNVLLLLSKCVEHNLVINNTLFQQADKYKKNMDASEVEALAYA